MMSFAVCSVVAIGKVFDIVPRVMEPLRNIRRIATAASATMAL